MAPEWVDFHFDVMCPWAYQTSRWMREVRDLTGVDVRWRFFSLEEINRVEGKKHPWEREWSYGWSMMRVGARLRGGGAGALDAGLGDQAIADPSTGDEVRAEHDSVVAAGGWGVPILKFDDGHCFFGPVL